MLIQGESIIRFQGGYLILDHGSVSVGTSTSMSVHVNCIKIEPLSNDRTQYDVTDVSGKVEVAARKKDVSIRHDAALHKPSVENASSQSGVVHEGQEATRDESAVCGAASPETASHALNTKWLEIGGGGGGERCFSAFFCVRARAPAMSARRNPDTPRATSSRSCRAAEIQQNL